MNTCYPVWVVLVYTGSMKGMEGPIQPQIPTENKTKPVLNKISEQLEIMKHFDTNGYDAYDTEGFKKTLAEHNISPEVVLGSYLQFISENKLLDDFSIKEMDFHSAMRAWLHCDYPRAMEFIEKEFDFNIANNDTSDFAKKYKFLNFVAVLIFENSTLDEKHGAYSDTVKQEMAVLDKLKGSLNKSGNSFLFNYLTQDYVDVITKEKSSIQGEALDFAPFMIAPKVYALDKNSAFVLASNNNLDDHLYVSRIEDYEKIHTIVSTIEKNTFPTQGTFNECIQYFSPVSLIHKKVQGLDMEIYRKLNQPYHRGKLKKETGVEINNLSIDEQFYFLNYLKFCNQEELVKIQIFNKKFHISGFRTFLSIEHGGKQMGEKILTLGEKLPQESAEVLFGTYSQMVDATEEIGTLLTDNLKEKATPELIEQAKESLLVAGKELLEKYADKASVCVDTECDTLGKELVERLTLAKSSVFAFAYACKTLAENGEFSFEDFKKAKLSYDTSPLPEKMKQDIVAMHQENTKQYPETLRDTWRKTLADGLEKENPNQMIVSVSYDDDVVSAMRILKQADDSWYGASFNVNPTIQGSRIGTELLKKVIQDLAKNKPFVADCYSKNPMLETYINKFGFQITNEIPNYENTGELVYKITLFPEVKEGLQLDPNSHQK
jgi:hypothetical protein